MRGFDSGRLERLRDVMAGHGHRDGVGGVAWLAASDGDVDVGRRKSEPGATGTVPSGQHLSDLVSDKPIDAVAALVLVEECRRRLEDPVDAFLPRRMGLITRPERPTKH